MLKLFGFPESDPMMISTKGKIPVPLRRNTRDIEGRARRLLIEGHIGATGLSTSLCTRRMGASVPPHSSYAGRYPTGPCCNSMSPYVAPRNHKPIQTQH